MKSSMPSKILITGGLGNLGSWITQRCTQENFDVYVLTKKALNIIEDTKYTLIEVDIVNLDDLYIKLDIDFDYCIHTASYNEFFLDGYPKKALEINTLGTRNLLEVLASKKLKKFVYLSTFHVYGMSEEILTEKSPLCPVNDYATTHLFAEYYLKQFHITKNLEYVIFRLTNSYGSPMFKNSNKWYLVLNDLVNSAYKKEKIVLKTNGESNRDFIWMGDVVEVLLKSLHVKMNDIYNLSSMDNKKIIELAQYVQECYREKYNKYITIEINSDDKKVYEKTIVDNRKLQTVLPFESKNKFKEEIFNMLNMLEVCNE